MGNLQRRGAFHENCYQRMFRHFFTVSQRLAMSEESRRLMRCFASVFPSLTPEEILVATTQSLEAWDSLASVTLVAVVQEEFGVQIDLIALPELDSFDAFVTFLRSQGVKGTS